MLHVRAPAAELTRPGVRGVRRGLPCAAAAAPLQQRRAVGRRERSSVLVVRSAGCPFCKDVGKCISICRNPQNVGSPESLPARELSAPSAVCVQLDALQQNNTPRTNHGLATLFEFCGDAQAMERSRYFGVSKDIYQMDHFMAAWSQFAKGLTELQSYEVLSSQDLADGRAQVTVSVLERHTSTARDWVFILRRATIGKYAGCWITHRLLAADSPYLGKL